MTLVDSEQIKKQQRIDTANALSAQQYTATMTLSWQDYADVLWAAVEVRQIKGAEGRMHALRLKKLAERIREALDRAGVERPKTLYVPPKP